jgi:hypothetical protein
LRYFFAYLLTLFFFSLKSQVHPSSTSGIFNNVYLSAIPEYSDLTLNRNLEQRKHHKIKSIVRRTTVSKGESWYSDSLIKMNPSVNFNEAHTSMIAYYFYNREGLLSAQSTVPANVKLSLRDSAEHRFVKTRFDSINKEYEIEYFYKNESYTKEKFVNDKLLETITFKTPFNVAWHDEDKKQHDSTWYCDLYLKNEYIDGKLSVVTYNNPYYYGMGLTPRCDIVETETYKYEKDKLIITKTPYKDETYTASNYINTVTFNKKGQITTSVFYLDNLSDPWEIYTCMYDKHDQLTSIFKSWDLNHLQDENLETFINVYDDQGKLFSVMEEGADVIYFYNEHGLLSEIKYSANRGGWRIQFEYTFY